MSVFMKEIVDPEWGNYFVLTEAGYGLMAAIMVALLLFGCVLSNPSGKRRISTRQLVFSAMAMALAMLTSMVKMVDMPMGGSVTLFSMFFICLIGYLYGLRTGLTTAVAYGFLQLVVDPYIISIPQMLTDYIFAFGALGLSGIFAGKRDGMLKGYLVGILGRYFFAFLSGMIFFGSNAASYHMSAPVYSLVYNGAYIGLEGLITVCVLALPAVKKGLLKVKEMAAA